MASSTNAWDRKVVCDVTRADGMSSIVSGQKSVRPHWTTVTRTHLLLYVLLPSVALAALTILIRCFDLDLRINRLFFDADAGSFPGLNSPLWLILYHYGPIPGLALGISATTMFVVSFMWTRCRPFRERSALVALSLALGPGLLVNGLLKPLWDRPRPCELAEFGGSEEFVPVLSLVVSGEIISKSFPCGHASMGFYLLAPIFVLSRQSRRWSMTFLALGLSLGIAMGLGRVAQGRHYPSDVLWSGAIVYFTGLVLTYVLRPAKEISLERVGDGQVLPEEELIFRLEDYRKTTAGKGDASDERIRNVAKRRAA
jgi:membrane-associated PAP2 superfamily phosphatase